MAKSTKPRTRRAQRPLDLSVFDRAGEVLRGPHKGWACRYQEEGHKYFLLDPSTGEWSWCPSSTQIAKMVDSGGDGLVNWAVNLGAEAAETRLAKGIRTGIGEAVRNAHKSVRDAAGEHGKVVHGFMEALAKSEPISKLTLPGRALMEFFAKWDIQPLASEFLVFNGEHSYAGTGDLLAKARDPETGEKGVFYFDLKTSSRVHSSHFAQCAGYALAREWMGEEPWLRSVIAHLPQKATHVTTYTAKADALDVNAFLSARYLLWWNRERKKVA